MIDIQSRPRRAKACAGEAEDADPESLTTILRWK